VSLNLQAAAKQADQARREVVSLQAALHRVERERDKLERQLSLIERIEAVPRQPPPAWLAPNPKATGHRATPCLLLTDTHFDEVVDPAEVHGINAYNREIAELRLRRAVERTILVARHYLSGLQYDGLALMLGGDIFSGNIHEELARTNVDTLFGSLLHWLGPMHAAIGMLADEFKRVHITGVPGNHGRMTRKPVAKHRATDNLDWLFYRLLQRDFAQDPRVTWEIPPSADARVTIYTSRYLLTHGDQFRGGTGISGALAPLMLGSHRKTRREVSAGRPYDVMVMGHWHQHKPWTQEGLLVGGCLKGYDEYAFVSNFPTAPPSQAFWLTTPEHGAHSLIAPIFVMDRKAERW
jgi:hypothetical protein